MHGAVSEVRSSPAACMARLRPLQPRRRAGRSGRARSARCAPASALQAHCRNGPSRCRRPQRQWSPRRPHVSAHPQRQRPLLSVAGAHPGRSPDLHSVAGGLEGLRELSSRSRARVVARARTPTPRSTILGTAHPVDALRHDTGLTPSRHCAGCHDPVLLFAGDMDAEVRAESSVRGAGVTCAVCHSISQATSDGNASYTLAHGSDLPSLGDADSLRRHRERVASKALRGPGLCASCHRGFLGRHTGIDHNLLGHGRTGRVARLGLGWHAQRHAGSCGAADLLGVPHAR